MSTVFSVCVVAAQADKVPDQKDYEGTEYQAAFDTAVSLRSKPELRGKWIRFAHGNTVVKWAKIS